MHASRETGAHPYERITAAIIAAMEAGRKQFEMPWHRQSGRLPRNAATARRYRGMNLLSLWAQASLMEYESPYWATYRQWAELGAQVRRRERATHIVFYKPIEQQNNVENDGGEGNGRQWIVRGSSVFNEGQVDGWQSGEPVDVTTNGVASLAVVERFVAKTRARIVEGGDRAFYMPSIDTIHMPDRHRFRDTDAGSATSGFYAVLLHELVHWTGHPSRLNRELTGSFGAMAYAMEELIAEFGAAFLCADLEISIEPRPDHAVYLASWIRVLKDRSRSLIQASAAATTACVYLGTAEDS